jgi:thiamine biosynthesis lipoprotein
MSEARIAFPCFGSHVSVSLTREPGADHTLARIRSVLEGWHDRFTRFDPDSELSRLNANPARRMPASDVFCRFAAAAVDAAAMTGGLVDPTLVDEIELAGYRSDLSGAPGAGTDLSTVAPRRPARPHPDARWRHVKVDVQTRTVTRPPGVKLDSGGIVKGLLADMLGSEVAGYDAFAIDCGGDIRIGGRGGRRRTVRVDDPLGRDILHEFRMTGGGVATSGIARRSWLDHDGRVAHHLLDPSTGRPAFTGIIQATALAPTALEAETLAKAAVLGGVEGAAEWLRYGGVLVFDDGDYQVFAPTGVDAR